MLETVADSDQRSAPRGGALPAGAPPPDVAVRFDGVTKTYRLYRSSRDLVLDRLGLGRLPLVLKPRFREFDALQNIDLTVQRGERLGIVGRNGAGKTTLLKLITGNFAPTVGSVQVNGSVQALMLTGLGFHPEFSGWDNIRSSLMFNGLSGSTLDEALEDVDDFCELGRYLHEPMKTYSQGMRARVQFAAATALTPDILIIDEVLEAGDAYFAAKCARRVERLVGSGCTLLLVSHSTPQVLRFCQRAVWIDHGRIVQEGDVVDIVNAYEVHLERASDKLIGPQFGDRPRDGEAPNLTETLADGRRVHRSPGKPGVKIDRVELRVDGRPAATVAHGAALQIVFDVRAEMPGRFACRYLVTIWDDRGRRAARIENDIDEFDAVEGDVRPIRIDVSPLLLGAGSYTVSISVYDLRESTSTAAGRDCCFDVVMRALPFTVSRSPSSIVEPVFVYPGIWTLGTSAPAPRCTR